MHTSRGVYWVLVSYLLVGGVIRVVWFAARGQAPDVLPLAAIVLAIAAAAYALWPRHAPAASPTR